MGAALFLANKRQGFNTLKKWLCTARKLLVNEETIESRDFAPEGPL